MRPRDRRRIQHLCWLVFYLACGAGLFLGLSGGPADVHMLYDEFLEPARPYWSSEQLGVVPFALPGGRLAGVLLSKLELRCGAHTAGLRAPGVAGSQRTVG